jgi:hypothetical protein
MKNWTLTDHARTVMALRDIRYDWLEATLTCPDYIQEDRYDESLVHALKQLPSAGNRVLRVVYNATTTPPTVVTVFFDRRERRRREGYPR